MSKVQVELTGFQEGLMIVAGGGVGGGLSFVFTFVTNTQPAINHPLAFIAYILLGMGAGFLGVYLVAKTDTSHRAHAIAFAIACGLSWAPIIKASSALVEEKTEINNIQKLKELKTKSSKLKYATQAASPDLYNELSIQLNDIGSEVAKIQPKIKSVESSRIANETVENLYSSTDVISKEQFFLAESTRNILNKTIMSSNLNSVAQINIPPQSRALLPSFPEPTNFKLDDINLKKTYDPKIIEESLLNSF